MALYTAPSVSSPMRFPSLYFFCKPDLPKLAAKSSSKSGEKLSNRKIAGIFVGFFLFGELAASIIDTDFFAFGSSGVRKSDAASARALVQCKRRRFFLAVK